MATIDGNEFNLSEIVFTTTSRTRKSGAAGGDSNMVTQTGYEGLDISITGYTLTLAAYDSALSAFLSPGPHTLSIRSGWQYTVYGASHKNQQTAGVPDGYNTFTIQCVCADPYQYSTTETTRTRTIGDIGETWSTDDDAADIDTAGTVSAKPDIELVAAGSESATVLKQGNKFT